MSRPVWVLWHGGPSYAPPTMEDLERFPSIAAARREFDDRRKGRLYAYPCVEDSTLWIYFADPTGNPDPYPDRVLEEGPRGGMVESPA